MLILFKKNTKNAVEIYLLEIFALLSVSSYQSTAKCLSQPPPPIIAAISKPLTQPISFQTANVETMLRLLIIYVCYSTIY